jgi:hypothetical protein
VYKKKIIINKKKTPKTLEKIKLSNNLNAVNPVKLFIRFYIALHRTSMFETSITGAGFCLQVFCKPRDARIGLYWRQQTPTNQRQIEASFYNPFCDSYVVYTDVH